MSFLRTLLATAFLCLSIFFTSVLSAQSCQGNSLHDNSGYYGGFEAGNQSIGAGRGFTDLTWGSGHGAYQIVSEATKPWDDLSGGGYLPLSPRSGDFMMLVHTSSDRLWYKPVAVSPGQTYNFCAWIASAKQYPLTGFEVRLRVKHGSTTTVIASAVAPQGRWAQICGSFTVPAGVNSIELQLIDPYPDTRISNFLYIDDLCIQNVQRLHPDINVTYVNVPVAGNVSTNDGVPAGTAYGTPAAVAGNPAAATIAVASNGTYTFSAPTPGVYVYQVPVCAALQTANCPTSLLTINVLQIAITNAPVANTDIAETKQKKSVTLNTLANDASGSVGAILNPSTVSVVMQPKNGSAVVNSSTGAIMYLPDNNFIGNDTLRYRVCDNTSPSPLCATALQIITVKPADVPNSTLAADDYVATPLNTPVMGNVKLNDTDPEGNAQFVTPQTSSVNGSGTLVLQSNGSFTFTPQIGYTGLVSFVYTTCDNGNPQACVKATLYILVQPYTTMTPLPASLLQFTAKHEGQNVRLRWETGVEQSVSHFVVEHSTDGTAWKAIGTVAATGNSTTSTQYELVHAATVKGVNQYRLQLVEAGGASKVSHVITLQANSTNTNVSYGYPNPFSGSVQINLHTKAATKAIIRLLDINGRMVRLATRFVTAGNNLVTIDQLEGLKRGTYFLELVVGEAVITQKIFKQ